MNGTLTQNETDMVHFLYDSLPFVGFGGLMLLFSLCVCCYLRRLRAPNPEDAGYKIVKFQDKTEILEDMCAVCLDEFVIEQQVALCHCGHIFHVKCLTQWLTEKNACPMCKKKVAKEIEPREDTNLVHASFSLSSSQFANLSRSSRNTSAFSSSSQSAASSTY